MFVVDVFVDVLFVIDMVASFRTGFYRPYEDTLERNPALIAKNYMAGWFWIDLMSTCTKTCRVVAHCCQVSLQPVNRGCHNFSAL